MAVAMGKAVTTDHLRHMLWAIVGGVALVGAIGMVWLICADRQATLREAVESEVALSQVLEEHARRSIDGVATVLDRVSERNQSLSWASPADWADKWTNEDWLWLVRVTQSLPQLGPLVLCDVAGHPRIGSQAFPLSAEAQSMDATDRDYFRASLERLGQERETNSSLGSRPYIGSAIVGRIRYGHVFTVSTAVAAPGGRFAGVVMASLKTSYFSDFYRRLGLGEGAQISLFREDGELLARDPETWVYDHRDYAAVVGSLGPGQALLSRIGRYPGDESERVATYRRVEGLPLLVGISRPSAVVLAPWHRRARMDILFLLVGYCGLGLLTWMGGRSIRREGLAQAALAEASEFRRAIFDSLSLQVAVLNDSGSILACNAAWQLVSERVTDRMLPRGGVGANYLAILEAAQGDVQPQAQMAQRVIGGVLQGTESEAVFDFLENQLGAGGGTSRHWFNLRVRPLLEAGGRCFIVSLEDITNARLAEAALREGAELLSRSQTLYRAISSNIPNGAILIFDLDLRFLFADGRNLADVAPAGMEFVGSSIWELFETATASTFEGICRQTLAGQEAQADVVILGRSYALHTLPLREGGSETIYAGLALMQDITPLVGLRDELHRANERLKTLSTTDALTGIANRRSFDDFLEQEWRRAARAKEPVSLLMIDVDFFKAYNDSYGHLAGDLCLKKVAAALVSAMLRPGDCVARYGGEEFVMVLPETQEEGALHVAERVHRAIAALAVAHGTSVASRLVSVSIGCATLEPEEGYSPLCLIEDADQALFAAKRAGRNRTIMAPRGRARRVGE